MKKIDCEIVLDLINKHQNELRSHLSSMRGDECSIETFKLKGDERMVRWCERSLDMHGRLFRSQRRIIRELAILAGIEIREFEKDIFIGSELKTLDKILLVDEKLPSIRGLLKRVA